MRFCWREKEWLREESGTSWALYELIWITRFTMTAKSSAKRLYD
jgi:hypothetical protein